MPKIIRGMSKHNRIILFERIVVVISFLVWNEAVTYSLLLSSVVSVKRWDFGDLLPFESRYQYVLFTIQYYSNQLALSVGDSA